VLALAQVQVQMQVMVQAMEQRGWLLGQTWSPDAASMQHSDICKNSQIRTVHPAAR
jgi:hypothetical protein